MAYYHWRAFTRDVAVTCAGSLAMGLLLAVAADSLMAKKAQAFPERRLIENVAEREVGARVLWARGLTNGCEEHLLGYYRPSKQTVVMCERNLSGIPAMLSTLKHETWHAVQHLCNSDRPVLSDHRLRHGMTANDKQILRNGYKPADHRLEAEARVLEQLPTRNFVDGVRAYCRR